MHKVLEIESYRSKIGNTAIVKIEQHKLRVEVFSKLTDMLLTRRYYKGSANLQDAWRLLLQRGVSRVIVE
jgi:hypothetical protein